jgi:hypothetical protein
MSIYLENIKIYSFFNINIIRDENKQKALNDISESYNIKMYHVKNIFFILNIIKFSYN